MARAINYVDEERARDVLATLRDFGIGATLVVKADLLEPGQTTWEVSLLELPEGWRDPARLVAGGSGEAGASVAGTHSAEPWYGEPDEHDLGRSSWWDRDDDDGSRIRR